MLNLINVFINDSFLFKQYRILILVIYIRKIIIGLLVLDRIVIFVLSLFRYNISP